ncbi:MAG: GNAT family N-acetyltransferase [Nitriliruptoraceae bacterium]
MTPQLRSIDPDELERFVTAFRAVFGGQPDEQGMARARLRLETDRAFVGVDQHGEVVATAGAFSFRMSLPGGGQTGCAGVSMVSVRTDHRRQGLLTRLMGLLFEQARERGEPLAALWASEAPIYGRYGFGPAIPTLELTFERDHAGLQIPAAPGLVELVDRATARRSFPPIRASVATTRPGMLARSEGFWDSILDEEQNSSSTTGPRQHALVPGRGYALYRLKPEWTAGAPTGTVEVSELHALDPEAAAALWRFVTDVDLAATTVAGHRPPDDPALAMVRDTVRTRALFDWALQVRVLDVAGALAERGYATDGTIVLEVADAQIPEQDGCWQLHVADGEASCTRTGERPDLRLDVSSLSTVYLGGVRTTQLAAAGRVVEVTPGAAGRLDQMLATPLAPWHEGMF